MTNLLKGKLVATVLAGCMPEAISAVNQSLAMEMTGYENMEVVGQLTIQGNIPCAFCGKGDECQMGAIETMYGPGTKASDIKYAKVEDQKEVWEKAMQIGRLMGERLQ